MKATILLTSLLVLITTQTSIAEARQYVVHVNQALNIQPEHTTLNNLLQKDITIDTSAKTIKLRLSPECQSGVCPEMLRFYFLTISKMGEVIQAKGTLPLQSGPLSAPGQVILTIEKNADNATVVKIMDQSGTSTLIASPMEETTLLF